MRQCYRCGNPMTQANANEWECGTCGMVQVTSYERKEDVPVAAVSYHDEHESSPGVGGACYATCLLTNE